jgi:beta-phosphoglucomutase
MRGAIFDLDGTLVSTLELHTKAWDDFFKRYQVTLTKDELKEHSGLKNVVFIQKILTRRNINNLDAQKLAEEKDEFVIELFTINPPEVFPGAEDLLRLLRSNGIKLALATSATLKSASLLGKKLIQYFDVKIFAEDVAIGKPDPQVFLKAVERLGFKSSECIVFEDAKSGVEAAKAGGFFCVAKDNELGQDLSLADLVIKEYNPQALIKLFNR